MTLLAEDRRMKLARVVMFHVSPVLSEWDSWQLAFGKVQVRRRFLGRGSEIQGGVPMLVTADTHLDGGLVIGPDGLVDVPSAERELCEQALEFAANTVAVFSRTRHGIVSAWPPVAFLPEDEDDRSLLAGARGVRYRHRHAMGADPATEFTPELLSGLSDRLDGLASVAGFLAMEQALAQYREATRFFEMAFGLPSSQLDKKLAQFLADRMGYTRDEVAGWLMHRHGAVHGDRKKTSVFTWDAEVRPFIHRIRQAVLDVLFNKAEWGVSSQMRRELWIPRSGTASLGATRSYRRVVKWLCQGKC
jgi:hypothetical protein